MLWDHAGALLGPYEPAAGPVKEQWAAEALEQRVEEAAENGNSEAVAWQLFGFVALSTGPYAASSCRTLALLERYAPSNISSQHAQTLRNSFRLPRSFLALVWCSNCISSPF